MKASLTSGVAWLRQKATETSYHLQRRLSELRTAEPAAEVLGAGRVFVLGKVYAADDEERVVRVVHDVHSRFWFTYRSGFAPIGTTSLTSDAGWGCMLRSGQMILAQALVMLLAGRSWRRGEAPLLPQSPLPQSAPSSTTAKVAGGSAAQPAKDATQSTDNGDFDGGANGVAAQLYAPAATSAALAAAASTAAFGSSASADSGGSRDALGARSDAMAANNEAASSEAASNAASNAAPAPAPARVGVDSCGVGRAVLDQSSLDEARLLQLFADEAYAPHALPSPASATHAL